MTGNCNTLYVVHLSKFTIIAYIYVYCVMFGFTGILGNESASLKINEPIEFEKTIDKYQVKRRLRIKMNLIYQPR